MQNAKCSPCPVGLDKHQLPQVPGLQRPTALYPWREPVCTPNWAPVSFKIVPCLLLTSLAVFNILLKFSKLHLYTVLFVERRTPWHAACTQRSRDNVWESVPCFLSPLGTELRSLVLGARTSPAETSCCPQTLDYWGHSVILYLYFLENLSWCFTNIRIFLCGYPNLHGQQQMMSLLQFN